MEKKKKKPLSEQASSGIGQHEDAVLKISMQFFAEELLPYFQIEGKVVSYAPTEIVHLELQKLFQDFNFVMENGTWKHFEFQSTNEGLNGLKRFRAYEALTSYQHKVTVETYVLFSGNIKNPMTEFTEGFNTYRIQPIIMQDYNADTLLNHLEEKQKLGKIITKEDLIPLILSPLMAGKSSIIERVSATYKIIKQNTDVLKADSIKLEAMLYALADKFLDSTDLEKLKEEISMTKLGQMIWEDGKKEGKEEGKEEGKISTLLELIKDNLLSVKDVAIRLNVTEEEVAKLLETKQEIQTYSTPH